MESGCFGKTALSLMASSESQRCYVTHCLQRCLRRLLKWLYLVFTASLSLLGVLLRAQGIRLGCCREMNLLLWSKRPWRPRDSPWLHPSHSPGPGVGMAHMLMWEVRFVLPITRGGEGKGQSGREQRTLCTEPCDLSPLARRL